ncbi:MAG: hypothetical protein BGO01_01435 [Armatimonadetes bacterium 55-13]|nr:HD-GYP domain-containing protein [Armatimonadota bacterium]OJU65610.1 MAG: hypothetical protein BGO01_01435 [Armatimonadetes bacterium 55-13]
MRHQRPSRAQLRLWALLTTAFIIVGVSAGIAILKLSLDRYQRDYQGELANLASITSMLVDPDIHEKLVSPRQMDSELYRTEVEKLAEAKRKIRGARYIYTLRKSENDYVFVLDPTPPGDHDSDGVDDKSYLGDPYPEIPLNAKSAYENNVVTVDSEPTHDRWGTFISGFAPIRNKEGKVVAVLGIDRLADDIEDHQLALIYAVSVGLVLVVIMGVVFGWAFTRKISASEDSQGWIRYLTGSNRIFRGTILEVALGGLAIITFLGAIQSLVTQQRSLTDYQKSLERNSVYSSLLSQIDMTQKSDSGWTEGLANLGASSRKADIAWFYQRIVDIQSEPSRSKGAIGLSSVRGQLVAEINRENGLQTKAKTQIRDERASLVVLFFISAFMAIGTIAIVRTASIQQQDLIAAKTDCHRMDIAYRQVVENLPIGCFVYADKKISFSNATWDDQCGRAEDDDRTDRWTHALVEPSADEFFYEMDQAFAAGETLTLQCKLIGPTGELQVVEAHVNAICNDDSEVEYLLGFTVDLTQRVTAQDQLAGKNREVQQKNRMLRRVVKDLEDNLEAMVQTLVKTIEAKCIYTAGHSERVTNYAMAIADHIGLEASERKTLRMGALLHDVGKIAVPDDILLKAGPLSEEEFEIIRAHPSTGAKLIEDMPLFRDCVPIVRWHHERSDGSGYPDGLTGDQIPRIVQIVAVADCLDAMTSDRAYRGALTLENALDQMKDMAQQGQLNPELVTILTEIVMSDREFWSRSEDWAA